MSKPDTDYLIEMAKKAVKNAKDDDESSVELTLDLENFSRRILGPVMVEMSGIRKKSDTIH